MANPFARAARIQNGVVASFEGAKASRLLYDWAVSLYHPDTETRYAARTLRARARDLVKNNDYAAGAVTAFEDNVVGWEGIRLRPKVLGPDNKPDRTINTEISRAWADWGVSEHASVDGMDSWLELQRLIQRTWVTDGEVFVRRHRGYDNPHAYAVEILDADLLDERFNVPPDPNGVEIRTGVEMDRRGRRLAYHFWDRHPNEPGHHRSERQRIPASDIVHYFARYRAGQTRGVSLFAPVLTTVKMVDGLTEAELVASRLAAAKMGFIENNSPEAMTAYAARLAMLNDEGQDGGSRPMDVAPGLIEELMPGQEFTGFDPTHPNAAFEAFLKVMLRGVARAFGMSYLTLTGDVGEANYSSMRAGLIPERDHWKAVQAIFAQRVHRRIYRDWMGTALLSGALRLPSRSPALYTAHEWRPRRWQWVDPKKDIETADAEVKLGVNSRQRIAANQGLDFEIVVDELADEQEYAEDAGVDVSGSKGAGVSANNTDDDKSKEGRTGAAPFNRLHALQESQNGQH